MSLLSDTMDRTKASWKYKSEEDKVKDAAVEASYSEIGLVDLSNLRSNLRDSTQAPLPSSTKCGVICQKKKKRKVLLIGFGVLLVGGISYFILKKK